MRLLELNVGCFGGGTGMPSVLGGLKNNPWLRVNAVVTMFDSGGQLGAAARRARRPAAGRHPQVRARPLAKRARSAPRAARPAADARARQARRPHRRQPPAVDDAAVQRRFPRCHGRPERAARLPGPCVAGHRRAGVRVCRVRRRIGDARRSRSGRRADLRAARAAYLARAARVDSSDGHRGDQQARRGHHRAGQLLHEPDADLPRPRRGRSAGRHARADHLHREPADRRPRHGRVHGG